MTQVIALPPESTEAPEALADELEADGWFPAIKLSEIRDAMRVGTIVTDFRLRDAALEAIRNVLLQLEAWKAAKVAAGALNLEEVEDLEIGGEARLVGLYRRAVYSFAAADLVETHRDVAPTPKGADRAAEVEPSADDHRRNAAWALSDMQRLPRTTVELI